MSRSRHVLKRWSPSNDGALAGIYLFIHEARETPDFVPNDLRSTDIRIFRVDLLTPTTHLLKEITILRSIETISLSCDLLAIPWVEITTGRLNIRVESVVGEEMDTLVLMDLGIRNEVRHFDGTEYVILQIHHSHGMISRFKFYRDSFSWSQRLLYSVSF